MEIIVERSSRESELLDVVGEEVEGVRVESEDVVEGGGVVIVKWKDVNVKSGVVESSNVGDGVGEEPSVEKSSVESVGVKGRESETLMRVGLGLDAGVRSIVMEESKSVNVLVVNPVGRSVREEMSVRVNRNEVRSIVRVNVSGGPMCEGVASVIVPSAVSVTVDGGLISDDIRGGVDEGKSVPVTSVGNVSSFLVEEGSMGGVKLKGGHLRKMASNPGLSSSLIAGDGSWAPEEMHKVAVRTKGDHRLDSPEALASQYLLLPDHW